jgi:acetylglutamate kinase
MARPVVLKLGGELLESAAATHAMAEAIVRAARTVPLAVVHGGGKEIDAALAKAGIPKQQVDGLRVTDQATLDIVVAVMAGAINTRFVAAINAAGGQAVGLTGADAAVAPVEQAPPFTSVAGQTVSLGLVGQPLHDGAPHLLRYLLDGLYVPVIATIGGGADGALYNVNADTMAAAVAIRLGAARLVIGGTTPGVLDDQNRTIGSLDRAAEAALVAGGTVNRGMLAKLQACRAALHGGVTDVVITDGRDTARLGAILTGEAAAPDASTRVL